MSYGQYDTIRYVGQELHHALKRLFHHRQFSAITIHHRDDELKQESLLSYSISSLEVLMLLSKTETGYHFNVQVGTKGSHDLETRTDRNLKLKRSKKGVIAPKCMDELALESLRYLKEYHSPGATAEPIQ